MNNEEEVIIDSSETNEEEIVLDEVSSDEVEEKPKPTLSERKAQLEGSLARINKKLGIKPESNDFKVERKAESSDDVESLIENISLIKNLEDDEIGDLKSEARSLGVPVVKYIKSKAGQIHLKDIRREKKANEASPSIGDRSPVFKKHTLADLSKMTSEELKKVLPHAE